MTARFLAILGLIFGLAACDGGLSLNPLDWFGSSSSSDNLVALEPSGGWPDGEDRRLIVDQVTALTVERTTSGAIVHATGLPPRLGYWDAELVAENDGEPVDGVLTYVFRISPPRWATQTSTPSARTVEVAAYLSNAELQDIRVIRVMGAQNARTARR